MSELHYKYKRIEHNFPYFEITQILLVFRVHPYSFFQFNCLFHTRTNFVNCLFTQSSLTFSTISSIQLMGQCSSSTISVSNYYNLWCSNCSNTLFFFWGWLGAKVKILIFCYQPSNKKIIISFIYGLFEEKNLTF